MKKTPGVKASLKPILIYAMALLLPILWLLGLEYQSLRRQHQAIQDLTAASMRLAGARAVTSLERLFEKQMDEFLRDPRTAQLAVALRDDPPSEAKREKRELNYRVGLFVEGFYAIQRGQVLFLDYGPSNSRVSQIARVLEGNMHLLEDAELTYKVYPLAITTPVRAQLFYMALGQGRYVAASLDLHQAAFWASQQAGPLRSQYAFQIVDGEVPALPLEEIPIRFQTMFPFWQLAVLPDHGDHTSDRLIFLTLTAFVFVLLMVTLFLLTRATWRHWEFMQLRTAFVNAASHDVRTPLSKILLYAELLVGGDNTPEQIRRFQQVVLSEAERLSRMVNGLLDFSRLHSAKRPFRFAVADIRESVRAAVDSAAGEAHAKGLHLRTDFPPSVPPLQFDASAVETCVLNLLNNAIRHSVAGHVVDIRIVGRSREVIVAVGDHGLGIAKRHQKKIFEEFVQLDEAPHGGYGLGLYMVKKLMEAHRGRVEVESEWGRGSEFRLVFPVAHADRSYCGR